MPTRYRWPGAARQVAADTAQSPRAVDIKHVCIGEKAALPTSGGAGFWPGATGPFATPMHDIPKVVFSNSLESADWAETTIVSGDLTDALTRLTQEWSGGYLLAQGGARFARSLVEKGLIDEYRLVVHPVVLGAGKRLFTAPVSVEPSSTAAFGGGAVAHVSAAHP